MRHSRLISLKEDADGIDVAGDDFGLAEKATGITQRGTVADAEQADWEFFDHRP